MPRRVSVPRRREEGTELLVARERPVAVAAMGPRVATPPKQEMRTDQANLPKATVVLPILIAYNNLMAYLSAQPQEIKRGTLRVVFEAESLEDIFAQIGVVPNIRALLNQANSQVLTAIGLTGSVAQENTQLAALLTGLSRALLMQDELFFDGRTKMIAQPTFEQVADIFEKANAAFATIQNALYEKEQTMVQSQLLTVKAREP